MAPLTSLGLGKTMDRKLRSVGVESAEELTAMGSKEALLRLKMRYPETCVVIAYHLQAAIEGVEIKTLAPETKADLKAYFQTLK